MSNSQTLLLMYWRLNSDKIHKNSIIAKYRILVEKLRFVDFEGANKIKTARAWAVFNSTKVADSISVFDSLLIQRFMMLQKLFLGYNLTSTSDN